jgi:hypothetical protein
MSWGDGYGVPIGGRSLITIGTDNDGRLHIRIFASGKELPDTDETKLPATQASAISTLKKRLPGLLPPHVPTAFEKAMLVRAATSIVGHTPLRRAAMSAGGP